MGWLDAADVLERAVADGAVPGAVLVAGVGAGEPRGIRAYGGTGRPDGGRTVTDTVFDLASLTKVVATLPSVLRLVDEGVLALDDSVRKHLPGFEGAGKYEVTIRHLLAHSAGLPDHREFYLLPGSPADRLAAVLAEPLVDPPGTVVRYSDLGFILLGEIVAGAAGATLDRAAAELVFQPLGMASTRFLPPEDWRSRTAATEALPGGPAKLGVVHDENAESLGGVAGHAGLFSTAADVSRYLRGCWLDEEGPLLSRAVRAEALRCQTEQPRDRRGLGWTLRGDRWDHMSVEWPRTGAGHTGFTGTSVALDPVSGLWAVLLTNAVHLGREHRGIIPLRRQVHDALALGTL
ncbi:serine hydrolase domain-containing protein [Streptacidiphilus cavernicola]|uniref:Serine hydrolase domain-containing protein n=1 Tax=Streptacidiphilus cavernicola TaxID=3342716 RepID=A0ABV6VRN4_9ACTN